MRRRRGAAGAQLLLELVQRRLVRLGLGLRGLALRARPGEARLHLLLAGLRLGEPLAHARRLLGGLLGAAQQAGRALAQQHDLVLGRDAGLLAVLEAALRRGQLALELE